MGSPVCTAETGAIYTGKGKTEEDIRNNRMEWIDLVASIFCLGLSVFLIILNLEQKSDSILRRKRNRYLALLIMVIWLPFYMPAFVTLLNVTAPSLQIKETSSELQGTNYHGDENYAVRVKVGEMETALEFKLPKDIYDRVSYDSTAEVTICKGFLGIDYITY